MEEKVLQSPYRHRSLFTWGMLFWFCMSLPRLWYLTRSGVMFLEPVAGLQLLWLGFLRDSSLVGGCFLLLQIFRRRIARLPPRFVQFIFFSLLAVMALGFGIMMVNAEVLHQAGTPLEIEYFTLMSSSDEGAALFITNPAALAILILQMLVLPALFVWICFRIRSIRLDWFMASKTALLFTVALLFASANAWNERLPDETRSMVADNYLVHFFSQFTKKRELGNSGKSRIREIIDPTPLEKPGVKTQPWYFPDPQYPLVKATGYDLCSSGIWKGEACREDRDKDGFPLAKDCNDYDASINPAATDKPRDGIDQDCSGLDAEPPNVIFIHFESARAANFGCLNGFKKHSTPGFDKLAKEGVLFTNAYSNGAQTRWSIVPMYCSTLDRLSSKWICRHNPDTALLSVPGILRGRGYHTIYVHGGDNNFSNHSARLWQWFEDVYDKGVAPFKTAKRFHWGLKDKDLFALTFDMLKNRQDQRPFFMSIATLSLHFPMGLPDPAYEFVPNTTYDNKVSNILRYADDALTEFIRKVQSDPQFENTVIMVAADHGINGNVPTVLDEEVVWVPLLLVGKNWNMAPARVDEVRSLADIGPTILDRLGVEVPNPFIGQSLLRRFGNRPARAYFGTANGGMAGGVREGPYKYWTRFEGRKEYLYDLSKDRSGKKNLASDLQNVKLMDDMYGYAKSVFGENNKMIEENRVWNWKYWPKN